ncbi:MAG TPA: TonB family protein, partial [Gammaproteobacteria bacterium]|nr:TonB family protein [Gammaproteobacteria bacterium]
MTTLRFPLAGAWGAVCAAALFAVLARLVNVPLDVPKPLDERIVDFTKIRPEIPVEIKHRQKPTRTEPPATPGTPRIHVVTGDPGPPARWVRPAVDVRVAEGHPAPLGTDRDVQPIVRFPPEYPPRLVTRGVEGWVKVQFTIAASGAVKDAFVVDASPRDVFDDAAL